MSNANLSSLCTAFSLTPNDVISDAYGLASSRSRSSLPIGAILPTASEPAFLPLRGRVHAGEAQEPWLDDDMVELPASVAKNHPRGYFLEVEGDCMDKVYPEGALILVDPDRQPVNGSIAVVAIDTQDYVMRRLYRGASTLVLSPDSHNAEHEDIVVSGDDHEVELAGTVVWYQPERELE